jgi:hypothetical protein
VVFTCASALSVFTGCATTPGKSVQASPNPAANVPALPPPENKPVQTPPPPSNVPTATVPPTATTQNAASAQPASVPAPTAAPLPAVVIPVRHATIIGSQETSILLDNFTAFVSSVDGRKVEAGRTGWNTPLSIDVGHRTLGVEFNRGVFRAKSQLEFDAVANARYELKYATDAELFGKNSFCNFWVIEIQSGQTVSLVSKSSVEKLPDPPKQSLLP